MVGDDISPEQAHESHQRLVDHYFGNPAERPRIHIPARPTKDDDLVVSGYIDQSSARIAALESELARLRGPYGPMIEAADREANPFRVQDLTTRLEKAESELAQLRREKAEREELESRLVAWLRDDTVDECRSVERQSLPDGVETVSLSWETPDAEIAFRQADGPTYEAALAAALAAVEEARKA